MEKGVTNNTEEFPRGESRIEDVVYWSSIVGFSPKGKGVFTLQLKKEERTGNNNSIFFKELYCMNGIDFH